MNRILNACFLDRTVDKERIVFRILVHLNCIAELFSKNRFAVRRLAMKNSKPTSRTCANTGARHEARSKNYSECERKTCAPSEFRSLLHALSVTSEGLRRQGPGRRS